jgi:dienelactone hydrolase
MSMSRPSRSAAVAKSSAGALLLAAAVAGISAQSAAAVAPFYQPPADLPSDNGALIRTQSVKLGVNIQTPAGYATRIMYKSTDTNGTPVAVTGTYIEPKKAWNGAGPRPLITYAEGTQGQGDGCAPSIGLQTAIGSAAGASNIGYEVPNIANLVNHGWAVVVTDYIGLGTDDRIHTYVNRVDEGHAVLDAARAALKVSGASVTAESPVGAYGYSQGGGASASAAELQPTYAPDVNLKAAYAGAPPADLTSVMQKADGTTLTGVIGYAVNGFLATYPQLQSVLDANTNAAGKAALKKIAGQCIGDSIASFAFQKTSKWTTSGKSIAQVVAGLPDVQAIVDAQKIGKIKPQVPVEIVTGTKDDIVTHSQVKQLATNWCALGANVTYIPVSQPLDSFGTSLNHLGPMLVQGPQSIGWMSGRLAGAPIASNCGSVPRLP